MADKTAGVRLEVKSSGFRRGMKEVRGDAKSTARGMGTDMSSAMNAGAKAGINSFRTMFSSIKQGAMQVSALVGGIAVAGLAKSAVDAERKFRSLAFTMGAGTGQFKKFQDIQNDAQKSALRWAVSSDQLAVAMDNVFNTVGDADFTLETVDDIAKAMRATGQSAETIAPLVAEANRQFGITSDQIGEVLPAILSLGSRGGLSVKELGSQMGILGSLAEVAGESGESGLRRMLASANMISAASGRARTSVSDLNVVLGKVNDAATLEKVQKEFKLDLSSQDMSSLDRLEAILKATGGGATELSKIFGPDLGPVISRAFGGFENLSEAIDEAAQSAIGGAELQAKAEENLEGAGAGIDKATELLKQAFTKPEMMAAIESLAQSLPPLAEGFAKLVEFVQGNPFLAGGGLLAMKALGAGASTAINTAMTTGGVTAGATMQAGVASGGKQAAATMAGAISVAAAAFAIALAADQAAKLEKDKETARKDVEDERENALAIAESRGQTRTTREFNPLAQAIANKGVGGLTSDDLFGPSSATETLERDPITGKARVVKPTAGRGMETVSVGFQGGPMEALTGGPSPEELQLVRDSINAEFAQLDRDKAASRGSAPAPPPPGRGGAKEIVGALGRTLRVHVTNQPADNATTKGPPRPGHERPQ